METAACTRLPTAPAPLNTRAPLVRDLNLVPAARPTRGWHGQAKQPLLQSALSVLAVVTDAKEALSWMDAATRVWVAAVWPRSMWSGSSAQIASKLVWRPPRHGVWPVPCSQGHVVYELGPEEVKRLVLSVCRRAGAGQEPRAGPRKFGQNPRSRHRLTGRDLRPCIQSKLASSLLKASMPALDTLTFPGTATPPCRGGRQTS